MLSLHGFGMSLSEAYLHCLDFSWQAGVQSPRFPSIESRLPQTLRTVLAAAGRRGFRAHFSGKVGGTRTKSTLPHPLHPPPPSQRKVLSLKRQESNAKASKPQNLQKSRSNLGACVDLPTYLPIYLPLYLSVYLYSYASISLYIDVSIHL